MRKCKGCGVQFKGRPVRVYCSLTCQRSFKREQRIAQWLATGMAYPGSGRDYYVRTYLFAQQGGLCDICRNPALWNGEELAFVMDHVDGDSGNNSRQNLRLICPNYDSQLPTYKSRNRGNGRFARRQRYATGKSY